MLLSNILAKVRLMTPFNNLSQIIIKAIPIARLAQASQTAYVPKNLQQQDTFG